MSCGHEDTNIDAGGTETCLDCLSVVTEEYERPQFPRHVLDGNTYVENQAEPDLLGILDKMKRNGTAVVLPTERPRESEFRYVHGVRLVTNQQRTIVRKEVIPGIRVNEITLPRYARIVHIGFGKAGVSVVHVWFEVINDETEHKRRFHTYGTGDMIPAAPEKVYVGTAQDPSMSKAWHVYEELEP